MSRESSHNTARAKLAADRRRVVAAARTIAGEGLVAGMVGNVSLRCSEGLLVTPTRLAFDRLQPGDVALVDLGGEVISGRCCPSTELPLHLAVYRARPELGALVHTHSVCATAWSFLNEPLLPQTEENTYYGIGPVQTSHPAASGSVELGAVAVEALATASAVLLGRHGVLAGGATLEEALDVARIVEHQAQIAWVLRGASVVATGSTGLGR